MKIYKYITVLGMALSLGSCTNFLEVPSETTLSSAIYYKSQSDFEQAINGAYEPLRALYAGEYGSWSMGEMRSDNTTYKYSIKDRGRIRGEYINDFVEEADNLTLLHKWNNNYAIISRVNHLLEPIDGIQFNEAVKKNIKGQAYFLRAFAYFDLVQYFGEVPLHLKPVSVLEETALPLSSVEDIYKQVIEDATLAMGLLPDKATQEAGRATSGSAGMLLANAYINQKKWGDAETVLKKIAGYELLGDYAAIYDPNNKNHKESIFEIQYKEGNEGYASGFLYQFIPEMTAAELSELTGGIPQSERTWEGFNIPTPDMLEAYEANDLRKEASIGTLKSFGEPYPYIKKYSHSHAESGRTNDNWPVYRYAETLLFLAECANEQNKPEALGYLNQVRTRAGLSNSQATGQVAIREAILKERRAELAFENKRWLDLVRSGKAESVMKAFGERVKANPAKYYFPAGYAPSHAAYKNIPLVYALPAQEVVLNPNFKK